MVKLSFIVPVFNVEKYLRKCVESLIKQDYSDYEIILVDDGSTDGSGELCDAIARELKIEDRRLKNIQLHVIHQKNGGLSAARNAGLKTAQGEHVCFVDSDDYWEDKVLGGLMEQVERERLDVLRFDYQNVNEKYEVTVPNKYPHPVDFCSNVDTGVCYLNKRMFYTCYAVMYIMRREIVPAFSPGIHFEDVDWFPRMMLRANRVNSTTTNVYNYLIRQGSITQTQGKVDKVRRNIEDCMQIIDRYNTYILEYPNCHWLRNMRSNMVAGIIADVAQYFYSERNNYIDRLKSLDVYPLTLANQGKTYLRKARLINVSPRLAVVILHYKNRK